MWNQDVVDASQLDVDLEAEVGERLRGRLHYVLHLHTLGRHAKEGVAHPLHLSCKQIRTFNIKNNMLSSFNYKARNLHLYVSALHN